MKKLFLLALPLLMLSCSSDSDSSGDGGSSGVAYIRGKIDETAFNYTFNNTIDDQYLYNAASGYSGEGFDRWYYYGGVLNRFNPPTFTPEFIIAWNNMYFGEGGDEAGETAAFYTTVGTLPTNYLTEAQDNAHTPGLDIQFKDADGNIYSSKGGSQAGSTFAVSGSSESTDGINGNKLKTVWGTFKCKLYNSDDLTDVIEITDGTYKIILSEFD